MNKNYAVLVGYLTSVATLVTFVVAILTEPLSGPFCRAGCYAYPYLDIAARFPADYVWMYVALVWIALYVALMVCVHHFTRTEKRLLSLTGLSFSLIAAAVLFIDYFVQLSVIQPSLLRGETAGISLLTQFNPHGVFIALEELGFLLMALGGLFMGMTFSAGKLEHGIRSIFFACFGLTFAALALITLFYGIAREYRFEIVAITINWLALIALGVLLARWFKRQDQ